MRRSSHGWSDSLIRAPSLHAKFFEPPVRRRTPTLALPRITGGGEKKRSSRGLPARERKRSSPGLPGEGKDWSSPGLAGRQRRLSGVSLLIREIHHPWPIRGCPLVLVIVHLKKGLSRATLPFKLL